MRCRSLILIGIILLSACNLPIPGGGMDTERATQIRATQMDLQVQQTILAQQDQRVGTLQAQASQNPPAGVTPEPSLTPPPPVETAPAATLAPAASSSDTPVPPTEAPPEPTADLAALRAQANILVYEDMVARIDTNRYVKETLQRMGLNFKDDGNAQGWLRDDLLKGAPNGEAWDLVIIASEEKSSPHSEFYDLILDVMSKGTPVIIETWQMHKSHFATAKPLLTHCGLEFQSNWEKIPPARQVMFPLTNDHPILSQPNSSLSFSRTTSFWWDSNGVIDYDIGDLMRLTSDSTSRLLVGTRDDDERGYGTLAVCDDGMLTLQTFSSHQLSYDTGTLIWENMIVNALNRRFSR